MNRDRYDDLVDEALSRIDRKEAEVGRLRTPDATKGFKGERYLDFITSHLRIKVSIGLMVIGIGLGLHGTKISCNQITAYEAQLNSPDKIVYENQTDRFSAPPTNYTGPSLGTAMGEGFGGLALIAIGGLGFLTRSRERSIEYERKSNLPSFSSYGGRFKRGK